MLKSRFHQSVGCTACFCRIGARASSAPASSSGSLALPTAGRSTPMTDAECCDAGRLLYVTSGNTCANVEDNAHSTPTVDGAERSPSPSAGSTSGVSDEQQPSSCGIVMTVCCLAERRQRLCRRGVDWALNDVPTTDSELTADDGDSAANVDDVGCSGSWTNDTDARVSDR